MQGHSAAYWQTLRASVVESLRLASLALAALVLCAGPALGKQRDPVVSPQLGASFAGSTTGPFTQVSVEWFANQSSCVFGRGPT